MAAGLTSSLSNCDYPLQLLGNHHNPAACVFYYPTSARAGRACRARIAPSASEASGTAPASWALAEIVGKDRELSARRAKARNIQANGGLLAEVAAAANLAEGPEGVRRVLRTVFQGGAVPVRDVSQRVGLPVPVVSAVRRELEKRGLLARGRGIELTDLGLKTVKEELGMSCRRRFPRPDYPTLPSEMDDVLRRMSQVCDGRPSVDRTLDQSHATPETALRRALYLYENDALEGRDIVILGDDDLTSLAVGFLSEFLDLRTGRLVILEVDQRLVSYISETAGHLGLDVEPVEHDLREPLPTDLTGPFDVFFTDPPYTLMGLELFVSRGIEALRPEVGKQGYVSFGRRTPGDSASVIGALADMGLAPVEIVPDFNRYEGSQLLGGVSQMIRTVATSTLSSHVRGPYSGPLYTGDR